MQILGNLWVINFAKIQIVSDEHLSALGHSVLISSDCQVGEGSEDHQASILILHCQVNIENRSSYV